MARMEVLPVAARGGYGPAAAPAWSGPVADSLLPLVGQALAGPPGRAALLLPALDAAARRAARLLLRDAARACGGTVTETGFGEMLLLGVTLQAADRTVEALAALGLAPAARWRLPEQAAAIRRWATGTPRAPAPPVADPPAETEPALGGITVRRFVLRIGTGPAGAGRAGWRVAISRSALAASLGAPAASDPDRLDQAMAAATHRLVLRPDPDLFRVPEAEGRWYLPLPPGSAAPPPPLRPAAIGVLPPAALAEPQALALRRQRLRRAGWEDIAVEGLSAALLPFLVPAALPPACDLLLRWSPWLADRAATAAVRRLDPARLILTGCDAGGDALSWGLGLGLRRFAGAGLQAPP